MRAMWRDYGKPGGSRPGYVDRPYTLPDVEARLAEVSGSAEFARDFFARYIDGHDVPDFERLLDRAGLLLRRTRRGQAWIGHVGFEPGSHGAKLMAATAPDTPMYAAGLDRDDEIVEIGGVRAASSQAITEVLRAHKPGERLSVVAVDRSGQRRMTAVTLGEDPAFELTPVESSGGTLTDEQRAFRRRWLESQQ